LKVVLGVLAAGIALGATLASGHQAGEPVRLAWAEGDVAGMTPIFSQDGSAPVGFIDYRQHRNGDVLTVVRIAHFRDGSSDEDRVEARVGKTLETLRGRSIIRNTKGIATVDLHIDVGGGRITGFSGLGADRQTYDEHVALPGGTYWGPLIFLLIKSFDENATDDRLVFRTVVATPKPRVLDMELVRQERTTVTRPGGRIDVRPFMLRPTINWLVDPIVQRLAPDTRFFVQAGAPPGLVRYDGPRNFGDQKIRIE
jgi:hypothetical protein